MRDWAAIVDEYRRGSTGPELADRHGVTFATIYYHLKKAGVQRRPSNLSRMRRVNIRELARLLDEQRMTIDQIAAHFGVSVASIVRRMRRHGLRSVRGHGSPMEHNFFWNGGRRREKPGYVLVKLPEHPYATKQGYVREHRLVVERKLGRYLHPSEVVHHRDGDPGNNDPDNLEVFSSHSEHMKHEWATKWYPHLEQLQAKSPRKHRSQSTSSRQVSKIGAAV